MRLEVWRVLAAKVSYIYIYVSSWGPWKLATALRSDTPDIYHKSNFRGWMSHSRMIFPGHASASFSSVADLEESEGNFVPWENLFSAFILQSFCQRRWHKGRIRGEMSPILIACAPDSGSLVCLPQISEFCLNQSTRCGKATDFRQWGWPLPDVCTPLPLKSLISGMLDDIQVFRNPD